MKTGDKVKFLNDIGGGTITRFQNKETAIVLTTDGFEMPVLLNELILDEEVKASNTSLPGKNNQQNAAKVQTPAEVLEDDDDEPFYSERADVNIYLAWVPQDRANPTESDAHLYLVNDSNYFLTYNILAHKNEKYISSPGKIEPNTKEIVRKFAKNSVKEDFELTVQILFHDKRPHCLRLPLHETIEIRAVKLCKESSYKENDFFDEDSILFTVLEEDALKQAMKKFSEQELKKVTREKEIVNNQINKPKQFTKRTEPQTREVDLHIQELLDNHSGLDNSEIIKIQLDKFHSEMKDAIKNKIAKIVFIHGVGNGVLKLELRKELQHEYKKYQFQDASFKEYGYGATMVILK